MPQTPPSHILAFFLTFLFLTTISPHPCPPFTTTPPPYPFSTTPFSGHPSFQITCSPPPLLATITINRHHFSLLHFDPSSTSLTLLPQTTTTNCTTTTTSIPTQPINFSNTPFKPTDSFCSRLSYLTPCHPPTSLNCSHCPWQCQITKNPLQIIHSSCGSTHSHHLPKQGCQDDILGFLDTFLKFGIEVEWDVQDSYFSDCDSCISQNGVCGFSPNPPNKPFLCHTPPTKQTLAKKPTSTTISIAIMSISILFLCFFIFILTSMYISKKRKNKSLVEEDPAAVYLHRHRSASLLPPVYTFEELQISTNHFDPARKIGDGGFGSVYMGHLKDNKVYAIKYLHKQNPPSSNSFSTKSFCNEILILSSLNHPNLVKLFGYCSDPRGLLLVYEYVPNGTLSDHLHVRKDKCLSWQLRVDIALQIANAIEYLHFSVVPPIVHRDITSNNVFVDKEMMVRVGDFGLSRLLDPGCVCTGPQGTPGYLDPDYYRSFRLTEKSDIYSLGVVLLELVTGMRAVDVRRDKREMALADMAVAKIQMGLLNEVIDPRLATVDGVGVAAVAELSFRCVAADKDDRPDAREVAAELRRIKGRTRGGGGGGASVVGPVRVSNSSNVVVPHAGPV